MKNWIIIGATSAIAEAVCRRWAAEGYQLFLVARDEKKLESVQNNLRVLGAKSTDSYLLDINDFSQHANLLDKAWVSLGTVDGIFIAHGTLPNQTQCEDSVDAALAEINTNAISTLSLLTDVANRLESQGNGTIAVISSVAGDRGRQSNYVYGASKAMVTTFLQGLRNRLVKKNVHVVTIKPGFVDTPMTAEFEKGPLWVDADTIAKGIDKAIKNKRNEVYLPRFWWLIMTIIKSIPEQLFKRLSL